MAALAALQFSSFGSLFVQPRGSKIHPSTSQGDVMKIFTASGFIAAAAIVLGGLGAASAAHARSDVFFSVGVQSPQPVYVQPQPVYVQPQPVYTQPREVYVSPAPVYVAPAPVFVRPVPYAYERRMEEERRMAEWRRWNWRHHHRDWDEHRGWDDHRDRDDRRGHGRNWD
jgi:hypothetical protein